MKLYKSDNLDSPFQSVPLGQSLFFHFSPLPRDGEVNLFPLTPTHSATCYCLCIMLNIHHNILIVFVFSLQSYVLMLDTTLPRSQYDFKLPQVSFISSGYHKHVTLTFNPTVCIQKIFCIWETTLLQICKSFVNDVSFYSLQRKLPDQEVAQGSYVALPLTLLLLLMVYNHERVIINFNILLE